MPAMATAIPTLQQGGWTHTVPLEVPPGPAGSAPEVSLLADFHVTDGPVGNGWALGGFSRIDLRSETGGVPHLDGTDVPYLDGMRLWFVFTDLMATYSDFATGFPPGVAYFTGDIWAPEIDDGRLLDFDDETNTWFMSDVFSPAYASAAETVSGSPIGMLLSGADLGDVGVAAGRGALIGGFGAAPIGIYGTGMALMDGVAAVPQALAAPYDNFRQVGAIWSGDPSRAAAGWSRVSSNTGAEISAMAAVFAVDGVRTGLPGKGGPKPLAPGPFAGDSSPARGPLRDFTAAEREAVKEIGERTGCHTSGAKTSATKSGYFVLDHQPASQLSPGSPQRLYPQCLTCSRLQGGEVTAELRRGK